MSTISFTGNGAVWSADDEKLTITSNGAMGTIGHHPNNIINFDEIHGVSCSRASIFQNGILRVSTLDGMFGGQRAYGGGLAANPLNSLYFFPGKNSEAMNFCKELQSRVDAYKKKIKEENKTQVIQQTVSVADEIQRFKQLFDSGVITEEEFIAKKKQLLGL